MQALSTSTARKTSSQTAAACGHRADSVSESVQRTRHRRHRTTALVGRCVFAVSVKLARCSQYSAFGCVGFPSRRLSTAAAPEVGPDVGSARSTTHGPTGSVAAAEYFSIRVCL